MGFGVIPLRATSPAGVTAGISCSSEAASTAARERRVATRTSECPAILLNCLLPSLRNGRYIGVDVDQNRPSPTSDLLSLSAGKI